MAKRITVLSAGPSLLRFDPDVDTDVRIGVNTAAAAFECDWWCAGDIEAVLKIEPKGRPNLFTKNHTIERLTDKSPDALQDREVLGWYAAACGAPKQWPVYSATAALMLAHYLHAGRIDVYGVDMEGELDWSGKRHANRGDNRWNRERNIWNKVVRWLREHGTEVVDWSSGDTPNRSTTDCPTPAA